MLKITETSREISREIDLKEHGKFTLHLRKPTWAELAEDAAQHRGYLVDRLQRLIVGWDGIEINGECPAFTWELFQRVCEQVPAVFHIASSIVSDLYYSFGEDAEKNSGAASSDS